MEKITYYKTERKCPECGAWNVYVTTQWILTGKNNQGTPEESWDFTPKERYHCFRLDCNYSEEI